MKIGLITDSVGHLPFESALDLAKEQGLSSVEVATGNWSEAPHADLPTLVSSAEARAEFAEKISSRGLTLSALCANGNQLHPVEGPEHDKVVRETIALASNLEVPTVVLMSGLPGARGDSTPNWITTSWPPETLKVLDYQWNEVAIPYWKELAAFARDNGVRLAVEACGSQLVHSVSTMFRLIEAAGDDVVGANLDPSHLMWMGADIPTVIRALGSAIFHVHAKDIRVQKQNADRDGLLDTLPIERASDRCWNYVTLGLGHPRGATFWADFVYTLRSPPTSPGRLACRATTTRPPANSVSGGQRWLHRGLPASGRARRIVIRSADGIGRLQRRRDQLGMPDISAIGRDDGGLIGVLPDWAGIDSGPSVAIARKLGTT